MKVEIIPIEEVELADFATSHGLKLVVRECAPRPAIMWSAQLEHPQDFVHVKDGQLLKSVIGRGMTGSEAVADYCRAIRGCILVIAPFKATRREFTAPHKLVPGGWWKKS